MAGIDLGCYGSVHHSEPTNPVIGFKIRKRAVRIASINGALGQELSFFPLCCNVSFQPEAESRRLPSGTTAIKLSRWPRIRRSTYIAELGGGRWRGHGSGALARKS